MTGTAPRLPGTQHEQLVSAGCALVLPLPQQLNEAGYGWFLGGDASAAPAAAGLALLLPCKTALIYFACLQNGSQLYLGVSASV